MSEDNARNLDADSTNPLPFEDFVQIKDLDQKVNVFIREQIAFA